jgi:UPF0271 protein
MRIDLNCDLGEGMGHDTAIMPLVSSANIACGAHAGDPATMAASVELALRHGVAIGAHPGYADRGHFGRRELSLGVAAIVELVLSQIDSLVRIAGQIHHLKLHGALYNRASSDPELAAALAAALAASHPGIVIYAMAGSEFARAARAASLPVADEAFVDRAYAPDGSLVPRSQPLAVLEDPEAAARQACRLVCEGRVASLDGRELSVRPDTLCIHGDAPAAPAIAQAVHVALLREGMEIGAATGR